jgi:hypothetical protein
MTSIVNDFDARRLRMPGAELADPTAPTALAALIAEERRALAAEGAAMREADRAGFENPHLDELSAAVDTLA